MTKEPSLRFVARLLDRNKLDAAEAMLAQLAADWGGDPVFAGETARLAVLRHDYRKAIDLAPRLYRNGVFAATEQAAGAICTAYRAQSHFAELVAFARAALRVYPTSPALLNPGADGDVRRHESPVSGKTREPSIRLVTRLLDRNKLDAAEAMLGQLAADLGSDPVFIGETARLAVGRRDYDKAISLVPAMQRDGVFAASEEAAAATCRAFRARSRFTDLEIFCRTALQAHPGSYLLLSEVAEIPLVRRQWSVAARAFAEAIEAAHPTPPAALYRKYSTALKHSHDEAGARKALVDGLELHPGNGSLLRALISTTMAECAWRESSALLARLLEADDEAGSLEPADVVRMIVCAHAAGDGGRLADGLTILNDKFPDDRDREVLLGEIHKMEFARDDNSLLTLAPEVIAGRFPRHLAFKVLLVRLRRGSRGLGSFPVLKAVDYEFRDADWRNFQSLMRANIGFFTRTLNSRMMLSVVDTYTDFGTGEDRAVSLLIANIFVEERIFFSVQAAFDFVPRKSPILERQLPMWDGFFANRLAGDDVFKVWLNRHQTVMADANPVLAAMYYRMFTLMIEHGVSAINLNIQSGPRLGEHIREFVGRFERALTLLIEAPVDPDATAVREPGTGRKAQPDA